MKLRARLMRFLRGESTDVPVRLRFDAPTVLESAQLSLSAQPVTLLGERWKRAQVPDFSSNDIAAGNDSPAEPHRSVCAVTHIDREGRLIEDQPDTWVHPVPEPLDFEDLPT